MANHQQLEALFEKHGYDDFRWIDPQEIIVSQWVRMKCRFGCRDYGQNACCPPNVPSVAECREFFREYSTAAIFHFQNAVADPEDRHEWSKGVNERLLELEREVFIGGHERTFLLFMDSCELCKECSASRRDCKRPREARPAPEALAMDVFSTVKKVGYPVEVLRDTSQTMNRYAFLMID